MKRAYYIDYPQEHFEGQMHRYRCAICKVETTQINGLLEGHLPECQYRVRLEREGYESGMCAEHAEVVGADEYD
jgi:DNA-directed RNA polymerase subunit RPC12/RpoP